MSKKSLVLMLACCLLAAVIVQPIFADGKQTKTKTMVFEAGEVTILHGLGAIIKGGDDKLQVEFIPPANQRSKEYKGVDLKSKDVIMMCNGKRVKSVADLDAIMEKIEIGDEVSFGIKRDKEMMIVSFPKADPEAGGKMMMMTKTIDDDGHMESKTSMNIDGKMVENIGVLDFGLVIQDNENGLLVLAVLPQLSENIDGELPEKDDLILSINGDAETSAAAMQELYDKIPVGDKVVVTLKRKDREFKVTLIKKDPPEGEIIIGK